MSMATMQVASQQTQSPVGPGTYAVDPSLASRRQYSQQTSPPGDQSRSHSQPRSSPHSSRRPSRRPSGNGNQALEPDVSQQAPHHSPVGTFQTSSSTPRGQDMASSIHASPMIPATSSSPPYQQSRREQRGQHPQQGGPPISPPPRTSSNQRGQNTGLPSNAPLVDRAASSRQTAQVADERQPVSLSAAAGLHNSAEPGADSDAAAAAAARSRRRGPNSSEAPQRAISTTEPGSQQSTTAVEGRSASDVASATSQTRPGREESQIINRVVVDDPAVDLKREQERQLESVPGLQVVSSVTTEDVGRTAPRSRQDYNSAGAGNTGRKKETRFGEYILGQTLGEGEFGKVKLGWKKNGEVQVAIKLIRRESLGQNPSRLPKIYREVSILRGLEHPNIVKLHEMIETPPYIGIILEYASGGELFDYILNQRHLKDHTARKLFAQLVSGVGYLHKKGIVHRDLKLENLLLDRNRNIVITDFGFANTFDPRDELGEDIEKKLTDREFVRRMDLERVQNGSRRGDLMATSCGSPCYAAPELVVTDSLYTGRKVDVWSCGVILVRPHSSSRVNVQSNSCCSTLCWLATCPSTTTPPILKGTISIYFTSTSQLPRLLSQNTSLRMPVTSCEESSSPTLGSEQTYSRSPGIAG